MAKVYVIVLRNALSVPIMDNNLIWFFITIESGLVVKDTTKIHAMDPSVEDYSIYFTNLRNSYYVVSTWYIIILADV